MKKKTIKTIVGYSILLVCLAGLVASLLFSGEVSVLTNEINTPPPMSTWTPEPQEYFVYLPVILR
jgi:hypothetical protein